MYYIVGDIGNTSTRICLISKKTKIKKSFIFETKKIFKKGFIQKLFKKFSKDDTKKNILFSSVVPIAFKKIKDDLKKTSYKILEIKRLRLNKLIKINIKNIKQLGSDRIVNSIAGKKFKNCLIIDFGTATTFDIVKNKVYEGGVIAPGVKLSMKNLSQTTALLPIFNLKSNQKWKMKYKIILTGGYAMFFKNIIKKKTVVDQNITIKGLSKAYSELL